MFINHVIERNLFSFQPGTTWVQETVWVLQHLDSNDDSRPSRMFQALERPGVADDVENATERWPLKTHLNASFFQRQLNGKTTCPKMIAVYRNPKDVAISYYHFHKLVAFGLPNKQLVESWDAFYNCLSSDRVMYGSIFDSVLSWWKHKDHENVLLLKYEDMKADPKRQTKVIANFLGLSLDDDVIDDVVKRTSFDAMKSKPKQTYWSWLEKAEKSSGENFFRQGRVGGWKEKMTPEQTEYFDRNMREKYHPHGIDFTSEISTILELVKNNSGNDGIEELVKRDSDSEGIKELVKSDHDYDTEGVKANDFSNQVRTDSRATYMRLCSVGR